MYHCKISIFLPFKAIASPVNKRRTVTHLLMLLLGSGSINAYGQIPNGSTKPGATPITVPGAYTNKSINYIRTWEPAVAYADTGSVVSTNRTPAEVKMTTQYYDGLGRRIQTVSKGISPLGNDEVTAQIYDSFGREQLQYLPYVQQSGNTNDGKFKSNPFESQSAYFKNVTLNPGAAGESIYYRRTTYETSPLNRPLKIYAPGNSWAMEGGNHPKEYQYLVNTVEDSVRIWNAATGAPVSPGYYAAGTLFKMVSINESGFKTIEFKDKEQRIVLKKVQVGTSPGTGHIGWLSTYNVYDEIGNLITVIPPLATERSMQFGWNLSAVLDELCFQYQYDERNRLVAKKNPGAAFVYNLYDTRDRLVFSQDGVQRGKSPQEWTATFYDGLNRPVLLAIYKTNTAKEALQNSLNGVSGGSQEISYNIPLIADLVVNGYDGSAYYTASSSITFGPGFVSASGAEFVAEISTGNTASTVITATNPLPGINTADLIPIKYTFYDNYDYTGVLACETGELSKPQAGANLGAELQPVTSSTMTKGLLTGTRVRVLGTDQWLTTSTYYDNKGRVLQTVADNQLNGKDIVTNMYSFNGQLISTYTHQKNPHSAATPQTGVLATMTYDHGQRLTSITKRVNDDTAFQRNIVVNVYDESGQLKQKRLNVTGADTQLDTITYTYNLQGWLQGINKAYVNTSSTSNWFGQEMSYDYGFTANQYNGNIAGIKWKSSSGNIARAYGYSYDPASRLTVAAFSQQNNAGAAWTSDLVDFSVSNLSYDGNGNIKSMQQKGLQGSASGTIDYLSYRYQDNSNKLLAVTDTCHTAPGKLGDFNDGANTGDDYNYDQNGNLRMDLNKGIISITYNYLNLPEKIAIPGKGVITYLYNAEGLKLKRTVIDSTVTPAKTIVSDYIASALYEQDTLQYLSHEEGRIRPVYQTNKPVAFTYDYFEKDNVGNVRVVLGTKTDTSVYAATMEASSAATENALFSNIDDTRTATPAGYPADATTTPNANVAVLNGLSGKKIGPALVLRVMAGDTIMAGVKAFYKSSAASNQAVNSNIMLGELLQAFSGSAITDATHNVTSAATPIANGLSPAGYNALKEKDPSQNQAGKPRAYLSYALFDDQFNMVNENSGVKQVQGSPDVLQVLSVDKAVMKKTGVLYIYTSNESGENVYFDNLVVVQNSGPLLEETHYYPFGLTMSGISSKALSGDGYPANKMKYNSMELNESLDVNLYETYYRMLNPQIGRWMQIDPKPDVSVSPYASMANNPLINSDPLGDTIIFGKGTSKQFQEAFAAAATYLIANGQGKELAQIFFSEGVYEVKEFDGTNSAFKGNFTYDKDGNITGGKGGTIYWNPSNAKEVDNGNVMSPATVLNHELDHAAKFDKDAVGYYKDAKTGDARYENKEEKRVIEGSEQRTARGLKEIGPGQVTRTSHQVHNQVIVNDPRSTKGTVISPYYNLGEIQISVPGKKSKK